MVRFGKCCNPVPGDDIKGYVTKGRGVSVHRADCNNLKSLIKYDKNKVVEVSWGRAKGADYIAEIQVESDDREGILADIINVISESKLPISSINAQSAKGNTAKVNIKIRIYSVEQLRELMKKIRRIKGVMDVYRMNS